MEKNSLKRTIIFYFSGTGNTKQVAHQFENQFKTLGHEVEVFFIESFFKQKVVPSLKGVSLMGMGHPVHAYDAPRIVDRFIEKLVLPSGLPIFIFKTAGDASILNSGASKHLMDRLKQKGGNVVHESLYVMPSNLMTRTPPSQVKQLSQIAMRSIAEHAQAIDKGLQYAIPANHFFRVFSRSIHFMESRWGTRWFGKSLRISSACTCCLTCIHACPMSNITFENHKIRFGSHCMWCMRCVYVCPVNAIKGSRWTNFLMIKGGYQPPLLYGELK